jgi:hypothetical protein
MAQTDDTKPRSRASRTRRRTAGATRLETRQRLVELSDALHPRVNRSRALAELDRMFVSGSAPDAPPDGFLPGRLLATTTWGPWDSVVARLARAWMPWEGKRFDASAATGLNRFTVLPGVRTGFRILWPGFRPVLDTGKRIEAFEFRTGVAEGAVDPGVKVCKIDYDFEANPRLLIRRILDELVQVDDGVFLGKVLLRARGSFRPVGFFMLERTGASEA